ncbi:MAG TPA: DUF1016 N-terminal domain-containing protein [Planctomycetota bacterium]|nr:DUF1016 N-terminal domain-containing protein [Planctomycetota bacterium]
MSGNTPKRNNPKALDGRLGALKRVRRPASALPANYAATLAEIRQRVQSSRLQAVLSANAVLVRAYWEIGRVILRRQRREGWGSKVIDRLSMDLRRCLPGMRGLSPRNLKYMRAFAAAWPHGQFVQAVLAQMIWYHNLALLEKIPLPKTRVWYARRALVHGWSRNMLALQISAGLHRTGDRRRHISASRSLRRIPTWPHRSSRIPACSTSWAWTTCAASAKWSRACAALP